MISCPFSSLTRKVAFGSSSVTTPGNSRSSSFAIRRPAFRPASLGIEAPNGVPKSAQNLAEGGRVHNPHRGGGRRGHADYADEVRSDLHVRRGQPWKARPDARHE